ncbi:hypothetical protein ILUMI_10925 [Ignelater luminosus]|uniref:Uncharacterized protein n=1 Tax=Ignelater luminosus TaxID=2038154 RepID=A0A8K0D314_IGNLU|nr:hypothetical protein ILUMI_10925 [Ignelater luminosus]
MDSPLRKLKSTAPKTLKDDKPIGGKGRLIDVAIDKTKRFTALLLGDMPSIWRVFQHENRAIDRVSQYPTNPYINETLPLWLRTINKRINHST